LRRLRGDGSRQAAQRREPAAKPEPDRQRQQQQQAGHRNQHALHVRGEQLLAVVQRRGHLDPEPARAIPALVYAPAFAVVADSLEPRLGRGGGSRRQRGSIQEQSAGAITHHDFRALFVVTLSRELRLRHRISGRGRDHRKHAGGGALQFAVEHFIGFVCGPLHQPGTGHQPQRDHRQADQPQQASIQRRPLHGEVSSPPTGGYSA
jgi:hypothetical protein